MTVRHVTFIFSDEHTRGQGTDDDPIRRVHRLWTTDGQQVAEHDPFGDPLKEHGPTPSLSWWNGEAP